MYGYAAQTFWSHVCSGRCAIKFDMHNLSNCDILHVDAAQCIVLTLRRYGYLVYAEALLCVCVSHSHKFFVATKPWFVYLIV